MKSDEPLPMGSPPLLEHQTPTGATEVAQRLIAFPFIPPDVNLKEKEALSRQTLQRKTQMSSLRTPVSFRRVI